MKAIRINKLIYIERGYNLRPRSARCGKACQAWPTIWPEKSGKELAKEKVPREWRLAASLGPLKPLNTIVLYCQGGFRGCLELSIRSSRDTVESRIAVPLIVIDLAGCRSGTLLETTPKRRESVPFCHKRIPVSCHILRDIGVHFCQENLVFGLESTIVLVAS